MSNHLAIATVTALLKANLYGAIERGLPNANVNVHVNRPDSGDQGNRAYVFLYQVKPNMGLVNADLPQRSSDGKLTQRPQVALDLHYLLSFYSEDREFETHRMLAACAIELRTNPVLSRQKIRDFISNDAGGIFKDSNLAESVELVKLSPLPLNLEDLTKLWSVFMQTPYMLSMAYQASVVLLEADLEVGSALPVLAMGQEDRGVVANPNTIPPYPTLTFVGSPRKPGGKANPQPSIQLGGEFILEGHHLKGAGLALRLYHARLAEPLRLEAAKANTDNLTTVRFTLPNQPTKWPAGTYTVEGVVTDAAGIEHTTNPLTLAVAPQITSPMPITVNTASLTLQVRPQVWPSQSVKLLLGDQAVQAEKPQTKTGRLKFDLTHIPKGEYLTRLRIDGVDSPLVDYSHDKPRFDQGQKVVIQ